MDVRVLEFTADGADSVALLEQSHPGACVLYIVTVSIAEAGARRHFVRVSGDLTESRERYEQARDEFFAEESELS